MSQGGYKQITKRTLILPVAIVSDGSLAAASRGGVNLSGTASTSEPELYPGAVATTVNERCTEQGMIH